MENKYVTGKYYELDPDEFYYSADLKRDVKFNGNVIVCLTYIGGPYSLIGSLIDNKDGSDEITKHEIRFSTESIVKEYELRESIKKPHPEPVFFMDF